MLLYEDCLNFRAEMKNLFKYLIPLAVVVAFFSATGYGDRSSQDSTGYAIPEQAMEISTSLSPDHSGCFVPNRVSVSGPVTFRCNARKTETRRHTFQVIKSCKLINVGTAFFLQRRCPIIIPTSITAHTHKLVWIGRLTI